jgi:diguanylate cyclase (GGDEF)-like protein
MRTTAPRNHAFERLENAHNRAEEYQRELQLLNRELLSTNRDLETLALYDHLTGLPNRCLIQDRMQQQLHTSKREQHPLAIIMVDLDRFKEVNDTLGHHVGDELLIQTGKRFQHMLRQADTIGRLGGDEFAVILPDTDARSARKVAGCRRPWIRPSTWMAQPSGFTPVWVSRHTRSTAMT